MAKSIDSTTKTKGPVMTTLEEFYKLGPGPSSSHTIGPMRITYDFYQRCTRLPPETLARATSLKVHLFGSLSATGAALIAQAHDLGHQVIANAAESSLEHHPGMTCDPVAGYVQVPCIERCAYGAVKAWTGFLMASKHAWPRRLVALVTRPGEICRLVVFLVPALPKLS